MVTKINITSQEIEQWTSLTCDNNHSLVRLQIAERFAKDSNRFVLFRDLFKTFYDYHEAQGHIMPHESYVRTDLTNSMLELIERIYGKDTRSLILKCL